MFYTHPQDAHYAYFLDFFAFYNHLERAYAIVPWFVESKEFWLVRGALKTSPWNELYHFRSGRLGEFPFSPRVCDPDGDIVCVKHKAIVWYGIEFVSQFDRCQVWRRVARLPVLVACFLLAFVGCLSKCSNPCSCQNQLEIEDCLLCRTHIQLKGSADVTWFAEQWWKRPASVIIITCGQQIRPF